MSEKYTCKFCNKNFRLESRFLEHACPELKQHQSLTTFEGRAAYMFYNEWKKQSRMPEVSVETFVHSRYYNSFNKFVQFSLIKMIPDKFDYIKFMVKNTVPPNFWSDEDFYKKYIEYFDKQPLQYKIEVSLMTFEEISKIVNSDVENVFDYLNGYDIFKLVLNRKLTEALLIPSKKFTATVKKMTQHEKYMLSHLINFPQWKQHFKEHQQDYIFIREILDKYKL